MSQLVSAEERRRAGQIVNEQAGSWSFLTNHARVLIVIARDPASRVREVAAACHITERTAQSIVKDLEEAGYMRRERSGRRTRYIPLPGRHPPPSSRGARARPGAAGALHPSGRRALKPGPAPWRTAGAVSTAHHWCVSVSRGPYDKHPSSHARPSVEEGLASSSIV
ncbi:MarR family transcriptional regulator [Streptomyces fagopyri]|uniref:MarR family transcriptional regulator n=1 Tax=Streptomyces fagopyri TaxID=2662397 RepID=UPI0033DAAE71